MDYIVTLALDPAAWIALAALITMEIVLGIDNLVFISILTNKLPADQQKERAGLAFHWRCFSVLHYSGRLLLSFILSNRSCRSLAKAFHGAI